MMCVSSHQAKLCDFIQVRSTGQFRETRPAPRPERRPTSVRSSYLSPISQILFVEKNLSCGEILDFCKEFEQFMAFYRNSCRFCSKFVWRKICVEKISVEKKWQIWGLCIQAPFTLSSSPLHLKSFTFGYLFIVCLFVVCVNIQI